MIFFYRLTKKCSTKLWDISIPERNQVLAALLVVKGLETKGFSSSLLYLLM